MSADRTVEGSGTLTVDVGQCSRAGRKEQNEDNLGVRIPEGDLLYTKGLAAVICDGMSGCEAGKEASALAVHSFLDDYFTTPDSWSVKTAVTKVLTALNSWLYSQGQREYQSARGMVTTFSAAVIKSNTAHLFHIGDSRIYRKDGDALEQLTTDHRIWLNNERDYLSRALGIDINADIDYRNVLVEEGQVMVFTTDGVHDFISDRRMSELIDVHSSDLDAAARAIVDEAHANNSHDNLSCLLLRLVRLPAASEEEFYRKLTEVPFPPDLQPGMVMDGYRILRELHASSRTQVYLAEDAENDNRKVVIKTPSVNYEDDPAYIDRFLHEEWVGRRITSPHVLRICSRERKRQFLYYVTEYIEGQTLREWMHDHPKPRLDEVRDIVRQIARGLRAFHRLEMIHQDLKPENIMIDHNGTVKIIDFGSTRIAGLSEMARPIAEDPLLGTLDYAAPEYHLGHKGSNRSDIFSLAVITYEMLTGHLPYGEISSGQSYRKRGYTPARHYNEAIPAWMDAALGKALSLSPERRQGLLSEFVHDIEKPNPELAEDRDSPLIEKNPLLFWKLLAALEGVGILGLLWMLGGR